MLIINTLLIIIILHLLLVNINNAKSLLNIELMENNVEENVEKAIDSVKSNIEENVEKATDTVKSSVEKNLNEASEIIKEIESDIKTNVKKTVDTIKPSNLLSDLNNTSGVIGNPDSNIDFGTLDNIGKRITPKSINKQLVPQNNNKVEGNIDKNSCMYSNLDKSSNTVAYKCYEDELSEYYKISDFRKNDRMYKRLNQKKDENKNIVIHRELLQSNNSCGYNTSDDIHLLDSNDFDKYLKNKIENSFTKSNTPCASNNNSNAEQCRDTGIDIYEKSVNNENGFMGYNSCYNEYSSYKSLS